MKHLLLSFIGFLVLCLGLRAAEQDKFVIAVMDPLAKEMACDCVKGFAQRDYKTFGDHLKKFRAFKDDDVEVVFAASIPAAIEKSSQKRVDMVIGKDSVVRSDLKKLKMPARLVYHLSNKNGETTFTGLVVVAANDPAKTVADLKNHRLVLGPADCDEKYAAAIKLFKENGVSVPENPQIADNCTVAGLEIVNNPNPEKPVAAVVSDYALVLIEGCKTIEKGALRVLAKTEPLPFIGVFVMTSVDLIRLERIMNCMEAMGRQNPKLLEQLESKTGFVPVKVKEGTAPWIFISSGDEQKKEIDSKK